MICVFKHPLREISTRMSFRSGKTLCPRASVLLPLVSCVLRCCRIVVFLSLAITIFIYLFYSLLFFYLFILFFFFLLPIFHAFRFFSDVVLSKCLCTVTLFRFVSDKINMNRKNELGSSYTAEECSQTLSSLYLPHTHTGCIA